MINFKFYTRSIYSSFQFNTSNPYSSTWFRQTFDQRWRAVRFFSSDKILNPSLMYILSDTRFKEQISSSAFTVRGHRSHRYASGFQNDRRLRLTTKGWNPLPFFRLTIAPLRYMHILPSTSSLFFFFYIQPLPSTVPARFEHTAIKIGKNCNPRPDTDHYSRFSPWFVSSFEAVTLGREENTWNYFKKASCGIIFDESNDR